MFQSGYGSGKVSTGFTTGYVWLKLILKLNLVGAKLVLKLNLIGVKPLS